MNQQERMEKENKTLCTEKCVNIHTLYINISSEGLFTSTND